MARGRGGGGVGGGGGGVVGVCVCVCVSALGLSGQGGQVVCFAAAADIRGRGVTSGYFHRCAVLSTLDEL